MEGLSVRGYLAGLGVFASVALGVLARIYPYFGVDLMITVGIQSVGSPFLLYPPMKVISGFGGSSAGILLATLAFLYFMFILKRRKDALLLLVSTAGVYILSVVIKILVARPRPDPALVMQLGDFRGIDSFPSGHVLFALGFYGFLIYLMVGKKFLFLVAVPALLMGISRIYLGAHWFSDVLGSYMIGGSWLYLMVRIRNRFVHQPQK